MKQTTKNILGVGAIILLSSGVAGLTTYKLLQSNEAAKETSFNEMFKQNPNVKLAAFDAVNAQPVDLTQAAENSLHAVVHIRSTQEAKTRTVQQAPDIFDFFFGYLILRHNRLNVYAILFICLYVFGKINCICLKIALLHFKPCHISQNITIRVKTIMPNICFFNSGTFLRIMLINLHPCRRRPGRRPHSQIRTQL